MPELTLEAMYPDLIAHLHQLPAELDCLDALLGIIIFQELREEEVRSYGAVATHSGHARVVSGFLDILLDVSAIWGTDKDLFHFVHSPNPFIIIRGCFPLVSTEQTERGCHSSFPSHDLIGSAPTFSGDRPALGTGYAG